MKTAVYIFLFCFILAGCRSTKQEQSQATMDARQDIKTDVTLTSDTRINEAVKNALETMINEHLNIDIRNTRYDTDKPADPVTGLPPVAETKDVKINRRTDKTQTDTGTKEIQTEQSRDYKDNTQASLENHRETKTQTKKKTDGGANSIICFLGLFLLCAAGLWYFKKNY